MTGVLRVVQSDLETAANNVVPVDMTVKGMIVAAYKVNGLYGMNWPTVLVVGIHI